MILDIQFSAIRLYRLDKNLKKNLTTFRLNIELLSYWKYLIFWKFLSNEISNPCFKNLII